MLDYATAASMGLSNNRILKAGRELSFSPIAPFKGRDPIGIKSNGNEKKANTMRFAASIGVLVFPLANTAYSGSGIPLNKFDTVRVIVNFSEEIRLGDDPYLNVTCVGEATATYNNGIASLGMY